MIEDALCAGKRIRFSETRGTAGNVRRRLVVTEARKHRILGREVVVQPDVELTLVESPDGLGNIVVSKGRVVCIRQRIQVHERLADWIDQAGWNLVARRASRLAAVGRSRKRGSVAAALEIGSWSSAYIRIGNKAYPRIAKGVVAKITIAHGLRGNQACKRNAVPLHLVLNVGKEEGLVLPNGSTDRAAKLIEIELFCIRGEEAARIEIGVSEKFERGAMELIAAGFRRHQNGRTAAGSILRGVVKGQNFEGEG